MTTVTRSASYVELAWLSYLQWGPHEAQDASMLGLRSQGWMAYGCDYAEDFHWHVQPPDDVPELPMRLPVSAPPLHGFLINPAFKPGYGDSMASRGETTPCGRMPEVKLNISTMQDAAWDWAGQFKDRGKLERRALKFAEEAGEVVGAIVKMIEGRGTLDQIKEEIGDSVICLWILCSLLDLNLDNVAADRFVTVSQRQYGFDDDELDLQRPKSVVSSDT